jgi:hypothetical protein
MVRQSSLGGVCVGDAQGAAGAGRGRHDRPLLAGFDVLRPTRAHVIYEPARVLVLVAQALARRDAA